MSPKPCTVTVDGIDITVTIFTEFCDLLLDEKASDAVLFWLLGRDALKDECGLLDCSAINAEDFAKFIAKKDETDLITKLFEYFQKFLFLFFKSVVNKFPPYHSQDHVIKL
jgi:hypothetical protein